MYTFKNFLEQRLLNEVGAPPPPPGGGGLGAPGGLPPGGPGGGMPPPPPGGGGMPPPPGGGMAPPMGGGMPGAPGGGQAADKLKAYNVWDVLERVLGGGDAKPKSAGADKPADPKAPPK